MYTLFYFIFFDCLKIPSFLQKGKTLKIFKSCHNGHAPEILSSSFLLTFRHPSSIPWIHHSIPSKHSSIPDKHSSTPEYSPVSPERLTVLQYVPKVIPVVRGIICSHTVKMTSWGFPNPTHIGHK